MVEIIQNPHLHGLLALGPRADAADVLGSLQHVVDLAHGRQVLVEHAVLQQTLHKGPLHRRHLGTRVGSVDKFTP